MMARSSLSCSAQPARVAPCKPGARRAVLCLAHAGMGGAAPRDVSASAASAVDAAPAASTGASRCPFAKAASFVADAVAAVPKLAPGTSPLAAAGGPAAANPHMWLTFGVPGQNIPGRLVSAMRKLDPSEFLIEIGEELPYELGLKKSNLDDPARRPLLIAAELDSLLAQSEVLEMVLDHVAAHFPDLYDIQGEGDGRVITIKPLGESFRVADYLGCPLELACRITQEDYALVRPDVAPGTDLAKLPKGSAIPHVMSAAVVVFSFGDLQEKLGRPIRFIHAPVPGFETELDTLVSKALTSIQPNGPLWRNNWALADNGALDRPVYGTADATASRMAAAKLRPEERWLKTEYQTLRRMPKSGHVLFTVRTFVEPLSVIESDPAAAATLASSLRGLTPGMRKYKGILDEAGANQILEYLDAIAAKAQQAAPVTASR